MSVHSENYEFTLINSVPIQKQMAHSILLLSMLGTLHTPYKADSLKKSLLIMLGLWHHTPGCTLVCIDILFTALGFQLPGLCLLPWIWKVVAESRKDTGVFGLLLNHAKTPGFLASRREEFNPGPETKLDCSELLCNKVLLKYKGDRESFWHRHQKGVERVPPC